jgi:RNA polymerase sigma-70 factor, ECF subfamily
MNLTTTRIQKTSQNERFASDGVFSRTELAPANDVAEEVIPRTEENGSASDAVLVARSRDGDGEAFEQLLARHQKKLLHLITHIVRNSCDAQDVLQEVNLSTWLKLRDFEGRAQFGSWLHRVAVNAALMFLRERSRRPIFVEMADYLDVKSCPSAGGDHHPSRTVRPDELTQSAELRHHIQAAVDKLPFRLRTVFRTREIEGCSTRQTAESLGLSSSAVKTRLHRAREVLRVKMEGYLSAS